MIFGRIRMKDKEIISIAKEVIKLETQSLKKLISSIGISFEEIVKTVVSCKKGKII